MEELSESALIELGPVEHRAPFAATEMPWLARLHRFGYRPRRRVAKRFLGKPGARLYRWARARRWFTTRGRFRVEGLRDGASLPMNAANTQFGAIYMPQYAQGYEPEVAGLLDLLLSPTGQFADIGANWGYFSFFALSKLGYGGRVTAVEPHPDTFADLERIAAALNLPDRLALHQCAVSDQAGSGAMHLIDGFQSGLARLNADGPVQVPLQPLDDILADPPEIMKIDVEGHEAAALKGAHRILSSGRTALIIENWLERDDPEISLGPLRALDALGYELFQPVWVIDSGGRAYALDGRLPPDGATSTLGLVRFNPEQRFLLGDQLNVFAAPAGWLDLRIRR